MCENLCRGFFVLLTKELMNQFLKNHHLNKAKIGVTKLFHLVESNTEKALKISVFGGSQVDLVIFGFVIRHFSKIW